MSAPPPPPPPPPLPGMNSPPQKKIPGGPPLGMNKPPQKKIPGGPPPPPKRLSNPPPSFAPREPSPVPPPPVIGGGPPPPPPPPPLSGMNSPPLKKIHGGPPPPPKRVSNPPPSFAPREPSSIPPPPVIGGGPPPPPPIMGGAPPPPPPPPVAEGAPPPPSPKLIGNRSPPLKGGPPPPPPHRAEGTKLSNASSRVSSQPSPPPVPQHSPKRRSQRLSNPQPPPPPPRPPSIHNVQVPLVTPDIPQPPVLKNTPNQVRNSKSDVPPPPPMRRRSSSNDASAPPPTPVRRSSKKSIPGTPPMSPHISSENRAVPPPPPQRNDYSLSGILDHNTSIPLPPQVQNKRLSESSRISAHSSVISENGYGDYDIPRPHKDKNGYGDYDVPLTKKEREAKERALGMSAVPQPQAHSSPVRQSSGERDLDHSTPLSKEERLRKEKAASMLAVKSRRISESSSDASRPVSTTSSVYSADASSVSLNSSQSGSKVAIPKDEELRFSTLVAQSSFEQQLEIIEQMVEDIAEQNASKRAKPLSREENVASPSEGLDLLSLSKTTGTHSSGSMDEEGSSNSGSNDHVGVWDDISFEEDSDEMEGEGEDLTVPQEEEVLDSWIKELESGIAGMAELVGVDAETVAPAPVSPNKLTAPDELSGPPPPPPPPPPATNKPEEESKKVEEVGQHEALEKKASSGSDGVTRRKRSSKTEKELARIATWRLSMNAMQDVGDQDLDALLADLCQLEEDTKAQLANTSSIVQSGKVDTVQPPLSPSMINNSAGGMSSDDFIQFMGSLANSTNIVLDPSRAVSMATYSSNDNKGSKEDSPERHLGDESQHEEDPNDIFSRQSQLIRSNSSSSTVKKTSSMRRSMRPGEQSSHTSSSNLNDTNIMSPSHDEVKKQLDDFAEQLTIDESLTPEQQIAKLKNEKLKIAMMKLKEASVQKMVLKAHNVDGSTKMVAIHEGMNVRDVCILLAERNHQEIGPNWTLVERLTDLHLERTLEDHEKVLLCLTHWPRTHNNHVLFKNNPEKYYLLKRPQLLMPASHVYSSVNPTRTTFSEEQKKKIILKELFVNNILPKLEGELQIRDGKKSGWKKHVFVVRASGLYYSKGGKSISSRDITRLVEWKDVDVYTGNQYKKFYRAPGNYCFSLVPHGPLNRVEKQIIHICVPTKHELLSWMTGIRLAKYGNQLQQDYEDTKAEMPWLQLEDENLDTIKTSEVTRRIKSPNPEIPTIVTQNGKEVSPQDISKKTKGLRGSFTLRPESTASTVKIGSDRDSHAITGPVVQNGQGTGGMRKTRSKPSILATAFQNAWKQGNLTAEMSRDTEKWPTFEGAPHGAKNGHGSSHESLRPTDSLPFQEDADNSGMFTLKRKKDKEGQTQSNGKLPRTNSTGSRVSDHSESSPRESKTSVQQSVVL